MKLTQNLFYFLLLLLIGLQSCSDDDEPIDPSLDLTEVAELSPEVLTQWTDLYLELDRFATGMRPNASARAIAYINLAAYEVAVSGMSEYGSNETGIPDLELSDLTHL